jgi:hypothetical protein
MGLYTYDDGLMAWYKSAEECLCKAIPTIEEVWDEKLYCNNRLMKLAGRVGRCYNRDVLNIDDRNKIFTKEYNAMMQEDPRFITAWLRLAEWIIRALRKENKLKIRARKMMLARVGKDAHKKPGHFKVGLILVCVVVACVCVVFCKFIVHILYSMSCYEEHVQPRRPNGAQNVVPLPISPLGSEKRPFGPHHQKPSSTQAHK